MYNDADFITHMNNKIGDTTLSSYNYTDWWISRLSTNYYGCFNDLCLFDGRSYFPGSTSYAWRRYG